VDVAVAELNSKPKGRLASAKSAQQTAQKAAFRLAATYF
jgi:hypothetical protein